MTVADDTTGRRVDRADRADRAESTTRLPREERRAQVLRAAREVFVAQGYHTTGMDDIAERAGVSKPVLYQHFPGKFDLYLALLDEGIASLIDALREALAATNDNKQRVRGAVSAYFAFVDDPDGAFRLVFESDLTNEIAVRERVEAADDVCSSLLGQVIAEDTDLPIAQAEMLASGLLGMAEISARRWLRDGARGGRPSPSERIPREDAVELIASLGWRGIRGFPLSHPPQADASPRG